MKISITKNLGKEFMTLKLDTPVEFDKEYNFKVRDALSAMMEKLRTEHKKK